MVDASDLVALGAAAGIAPRLLGPTADYLGQRILEGAKGVENVAKIFIRANEKLGDAETGDGFVPPRVLRGILSEGPFCEDSVAVEYLSGVLAASRGLTGDDRGVSHIATISRLSSAALRTHFVLYRALYEEVTSATEESRWTRETIPLYNVESLIAALDLSSLNNVEHAASISSHVFSSLGREALISRPSIRWSHEMTKSAGWSLPFEESSLGAELFAFSLGYKVSSVKNLPAGILFGAELPRIDVHFIDRATVESFETKQLTDAIKRELEEELAIKNWAFANGVAITYEGHLLSPELRLAYYDRDQGGDPLT